MAIEINDAFVQVDETERAAAKECNLMQLRGTLKKDLLKTLDEVRREPRGLDATVVTRVEDLYQEGIMLADRVDVLASPQDPLRSAVVGGIYGIKKEVEGLCEGAFHSKVEAVLAQTRFHPLETATWFESTGWKRLCFIDGEDGKDKARQAMKGMRRVAEFKVVTGPPHHDYRGKTVWILYKSH